jgi:Ferric reductase like transmembrane component
MAWLPLQRCLLPLCGSIILNFCLSIGLTFRSNYHCFAGTCGENLFPLQARIHVVVWYAWLSIAVTILAFRAYSPNLRRILRTPVFERKIPILGKHLAVSGCLIVLGIVSLYGIIFGIWWIRLQQYFVGVGRDNGINEGGNRLAAIALTGHLCDVTMGMVLLPISRHSAWSSFFKLSVSTTLAFHMLGAYTLFTLVMSHGLLYVAWVPIYHSLSEAMQIVLPVLNPTLPYNQVWPGDRSPLGIWRASLIFTGIAASVIMLLLLLTSLPWVRQKHFNTFYFTHFLAIAAVIIICIHASTMLYCTIPGLSLWLLDWLLRASKLRQKLEGEVTAIGKGWYW